MRRLRRLSIPAWCVAAAWVSACASAPAVSPETRATVPPFFLSAPILDDFRNRRAANPDLSLGVFSLERFIDCDGDSQRYDPDLTALLVERIRSAVAPETWGEPGPWIGEDGWHLVVFQRPEVIEQVRNFLDRITEQDDFHEVFVVEFHVYAPDSETAAELAAIPAPKPGLSAWTLPLDSEQARKLSRHRAGLLSAPVITVFGGQQARIVTLGQPVVQVVEDYVACTYDGAETMVPVSRALNSGLSGTVLCTVGEDPARVHVEAELHWTRVGDIKEVPSEFGPVQLADSTNVEYGTSWDQGRDAWTLLVLPGGHPGRVCALVHVREQVFHGSPDAWRR